MNIIKSIFNSNKPQQPEDIFEPDRAATQPTGTSKGKAANFAKNIRTEQPTQDSGKVKAGVVKTMPTNETNRRALASQLKPGDVVFTKYALNTPSAHIFTIIGQKFAQLLYGRKEIDEQHRMIHAAIVVEVNHETGEVKVAESAIDGGENEINQYDLFSVELPPGCEYHVLRANDDESRKIADKAAQIAYGLSTEAGGNAKHSYSITKAIKSVFSIHLRSPSDGYTKRLYKRMADEYVRDKSQNIINPTQATGGSRGKGFFCSYFIAHAFQQAELGENFDKLFKREGGPQLKAELEQIKQLPQDQQNEAIREWARKAAKTESGKNIAWYAKYRFRFHMDPKRTSPAELLSELKDTGNFTQHIILKATNTT